MQIITTLKEFLSSQTDIILLILVFICVSLLILSIAGFFTRADPIDGRLRGTAKQNAADFQGTFGRGRGGENELTQQLLLEQKGGLRLALSDAGFTAEYAPIYYTIFQIGCASIMALTTYFGITMFFPAVDIKMVLAVSAGNALIGFMLPNFFLSRRKAKRMLEVEHSFPDALDMLLVSMEAGASLDGALERVGREIGRAHPLLSQHLLSIGHELRAGTSREAAFRRFGKRIPTDDVRSFVALFVQTDRLGTSVATALRVHADEMRTKRVLRAEEKAHQLPVKLAIPLVLFILPALMLVIMTPAIIRIANSMLF
ncbi:MAG: type II secretion system F family protein [Sneathiella sp.]|uniref:type II secretion system F family protein n=1 Tax=Sneathiella sp. TaxID=1964365 RepID=UPI003000FBC3